MAKVKTATIEINYTLEGPEDAPVLMFSNSLGANLSMWEPQAAAFNSNYRVLRYDHRGHGASAVPPGPYTFAELCNDAVALMDVLDIQQVDFVGLSMGGMTALGLALDHPQRVRSITACNCVAGYGPDGLKVWEERIAAISANGLEPILEGTLQRWFTQPTIDARPAEMDAVRDMIRATPQAGYLACCEALKKLAYTDRLSAITTPTLFIAGSHDLGAPAAAMREMHALVPGSIYAELDAAHVSSLERPQAFNDTLAQFLLR